MRTGATERAVLLLLAHGAAPSAQDLCSAVADARGIECTAAGNSLGRLLRRGLVRRLPGRGAPRSWGALALTASGRRYLAHRRTWWERKHGAPERPEDWGRPQPLLVPSQPELDEEPGPEPAAVGVLETPRRRERVPRLSDEDREERFGIVLRGISAGVALAGVKAFGREAPSVAQAPVARRGATVPYGHCPVCRAPAGALELVPPPRGDPAYRAVRCARCWGVFAR